MSLAMQLFWDVAYPHEAYHLELLHYHDDIALVYSCLTILAKLASSSFSFLAISANLLSNSLCSILDRSSSQNGY